MSGTTRELERGEWSQYFASIAPAIAGLLVTIEVMTSRSETSEAHCERPGSRSAP